MGQYYEALASKRRGSRMRDVRETVTLYQREGRKAYHTCD